MSNQDIERLKNLLGTHVDFPQKGIVFKDIFPIFQDPTAVEAMVCNIVHHINSTYSEKIDAVVGLDARGFLLGPIIALRLGAAFVPVRKQGKLPGECVQATYVKEYGEDVFEMQKNALKEGHRVIVIDDLIATGGSAEAAGELIKKCNAKTVEYVFIIELDFLNGAKTLDAPVYSLIHL
ncbi:adenine phosphoribosyltransferase [Cokeromyces recurvatus]|uniref:adenine phosphoribosyltransferase n=1 Tax=Cokeromyces recurvatus TaxID=90255 RepID=UPI0022210E89|nr:adenine phosphoribosyltransferase [Cokeromyces recurvatus]KAI7904530.1 adenine phosphoribosyltransferase [Cokeromyces recurvatus]